MEPEQATFVIRGGESRKLMSQNQPEIQYAAFLAIDWADQKHVWSLQEANSSTRLRGEVDHMPEAVETWVAQMSQRFAGRPIAVAVEQSRGALVFLLSKYEQLHIFPVPPAMTANLRKAFYSSGAKSDPTDADLLLDLVQRHREKLRRLSPDTEATRLIQNLVEERRKLVDEKTAQSNRLEAHLKIYFPQIPRWFGDVDSPLVCALLAAFGSQRERYQNAVEVQTFSGIAPVTESSGKSSWVHFRFACSKFLRQSFHEWAALSIPQSQWARAYYELQCRRGKKHHAAVRALAFKWIRIIYRGWKERVAYDENVYIEALAKHK